jgi:hypothetical protein
MIVRLSVPRSSERFETITGALAYDATRAKRSTIPSAIRATPAACSMFGEPGSDATSQPHPQLRRHERLRGDQHDRPDERQVQQPDTEADRQFVEADADPKSDDREAVNARER